MLLLRSLDVFWLHQLLENLTPLPLKILENNLHNSALPSQFPELQFSALDPAFCCLETQNLTGIYTLFFIPNKFEAPIEEMQLWVDALLLAGVPNLFLLSYANLAQNSKTGDYVDWQNPWSQLELESLRGQAEGLNITIFNALSDSLPKQIPLLANAVKSKLAQTTSSSCRIILHQNCRELELA